MWDITKPPVVAFMLIAISLALHYFFPIMRIVVYPFNFAGIIVSLIGLSISLSSSYAFIKNELSFTPKEKPKRLETGGAFSYSRNPMYLGGTLMLLGVAIFLGSVSAFISPLLFFTVINFGFIPYEEKMLKKLFGKKYEDYKKNVRRWI